MNTETLIHHLQREAARVEMQIETCRRATPDDKVAPAYLRKCRRSLAKMVAEYAAKGVRNAYADQVNGGAS